MMQFFFRMRRLWAAEGDLMVAIFREETDIESRDVSDRFRGYVKLGLYKCWFFSVPHQPGVFVSFGIRIFDVICSDEITIYVLQVWTNRDSYSRI